MTLLYLVRHGRAAAGWDTSLDPELDDLGREQSAAAASRLTVLLQDTKWSLTDVDVVSSPLRRCRETADAYTKITGQVARIEPRIAEIPSPTGVALVDRTEWLREVMAGTWAQVFATHGEVYRNFHSQLVQWASAVRRDTIAFSHFIAINALIGAATGDDRVMFRSLDNASITTLHVDDDGTLTLVGGGAEADTLIR